MLTSRWWSGLTRWVISVQFLIGQAQSLGNCSFKSIKMKYTQVVSISLPGWSLQIIFVSYCLVPVIGQETTKSKGCVSVDSWIFWIGEQLRGIINHYTLVDKRFCPHRGGVSISSCQVPRVSHYHLLDCRFRLLSSAYAFNRGQYVVDLHTLWFFFNISCAILFIKCIVFVSLHS